MPAGEQGVGALPARTPNAMKYRRLSRAIWITVSIIAVFGMLAFTLLPVLSYR